MDLIAVWVLKIRVKFKVVNYFYKSYQPQLAYIQFLFNSASTTETFSDIV
jgi:hypothetical protein